jgi:hypothetical protein
MKYCYLEVFLEAAFFFIVSILEVTIGFRLHWVPNWREYWHHFNYCFVALEENIDFSKQIIASFSFDWERKFGRHVL